MGNAAIRYTSIKGLFQEAHGEANETPDIAYHKRFEIDSAVPVVVAYGKKCQEEESPLFAQRLSRQQNGEWRWIIDNSKLIEALDFGDEVDEDRFNETVTLFIERRDAPEQKPADRTREF